MTTAPAITFLMPVYNSAATVCAAIESVLSQRDADLELLIINDGSTDDTPHVLASIADARLRVLTNDGNRGLSWSLNRGLAAARGAFIARMDADDLCVPHRAAVQAQFLKDHPHVAVVGSFIETFHSESGPGVPVTYPTAPEAVEAALLFRNVLAHPAVMFRRDALQRAGLRYDEAYRCAQDYGLWLGCVEKGLALANVGDVLLRYRLHAGQLSHTFSGMQEEGRIIRDHLLRHLIPGVAPAQLAAHDAVARDRLAPVAGDLEDADAWLRELYRWNEQHGRFDAQALGAVLCGRWVRVLKLAQSIRLPLPVDGHPLARYLHPAVRFELRSTLTPLEPA